MGKFIEELKKKTNSNTPGVLSVHGLVYYDPAKQYIIELGEQTFNIVQLKELIEHMERK